MNGFTSCPNKVHFMAHLGKRIFISTVAALMAIPAGASEIVHRTEYRVSLGILTIARAAFLTKIEDDKSYRVSGDISSAGLADLVTNISAKTSVDGVLRGDRLQASRYYLYYKSGKRARTYEVRYSNGNITSTTVKPPRRLPKNWVNVPASDMRSVLDPISGLIFPGDADVCAQKLPIYDGEMRMDLVLSPKGAQNFSTAGFSGKATVCSVRFVPRSGYKKGRSDIDYLSKSSRMEIWFAKSDTANVYAPVYVRIPTQYGPVTITAVKYGAS
ncbi:hypothetical protein J2W42_006247 [Rhizobium tibeticum]|uniref:DUF3108 domain-containing protein n=2 Tax=Rhizobium tibeticum TaxID=501024 RepID=A0A1H8EQS2_9HYPH|nr:hypothetical protein [Rhizobium tibeticum]SEH38018.1 hypothetical protein RTCCBAU85039_0028 [Rhizobium tibeticum]SEN21835.1 Protein of unknown function [Rhizobium tibeticum]